MTIAEKVCVHQAYGIVEGIDKYGIPDGESEDEFIRDASERHGEFDIYLGHEGRDRWTRFRAGQNSDDDAALIRALVAEIRATGHRYQEDPEWLLRKARGRLTPV